jgi:hypothetical protein
MATSPSWSGPATIEAKVRRRWVAGDLLRAHARGEPFPTIDVPLRGPTSRDVAADLGRVRRWADDLERGARRAGGTAYHLTMRTVGGRESGRNQLPDRALVSGYDEAWRLLGVGGDVAGFDGALAATRERQPDLAAWVVEHPMAVLPLAVDWPRVLETVAWLRTHAGSGRYLREIGAPGVDTKFVEGHRAVLADLLDAVLPEGGVDRRRSRGREFAERYGFSAPTPLIRLRPAVGALPISPYLTEVAMGATDLAAIDARPRRVLVVENEVSYLSLPVSEGEVVVFGSGYTVAALGRISWLGTCPVDYWGDLDTHGFAILDRLRAWHPHVRSVLMDRATLLAHRDRWVAEPTPTRAALTRLTPAESDVYRDLVEDTFGPAVRLEQERIDWPWVMDAMSALDQTEASHEAAEET